MGESIGKNISKNLSGKQCPGMLAACQKLLIVLKNLQQMHLNMLQKEQFKKQEKQLVIWLVIKLLTRGFQKFDETVTNDNDKEIPKERYIYIYCNIYVQITKASKMKIWKK